LIEGFNGNRRITAFVGWGMMLRSLVVQSPTSE